LKIKKRLGLRFALKNPQTGEIKFEAKGDVGDGLYYESKDKLISKIIKTKGTGYYWLSDIKDPHW